MFNQTHLKRSLVAGVAIGAGALPSVAHADLIARAGAGGAKPVTATHVRVARSDSITQTGFIWGDAGIGAGGALVLIGGGVAGAATMRRRRTIHAA